MTQTAGHTKRPSDFFLASLRREFAPSPDQQAQQFYSRGVKYNAVGGLKGVHAWAFAWALCVTLPCLIVAKTLETLYDFTRRIVKIVTERGWR
jgi:hypothetical protein